MMTNAKRTPGPWEAIGNLVRSPMHKPDGLPQGVQIADCRYSYFLPHTDEAKANARLIAAAPELLDVATWLVRIAGSQYHGDDAAEQFDALVIQARSAIAKATGEEV